MRKQYLFPLAIICLLALTSCTTDERRSWLEPRAGFTEETEGNLSFTLMTAFAEQGDSVFIAGDITPEYLDDSNAMVFVGLFGEHGTLHTPYRRYVWGNESFRPYFWRKDSNGRYHRELNFSAMGVLLKDLAADRFGVARRLQLYVDDGTLKVDPIDTVDSLTTVHIWYTGDSFADSLDYMNSPADPDVPVYYMSTWTSFNHTTHPMVWDDEMWKTDFPVVPGSITLLRLNLESGQELRSGVHVGLDEDEFEDATLLMNMYHIGGDWWAFEFVLEDSVVTNLRDADERMYTFDVGN